MKTLNQTSLGYWANIINLLIRKQKWKEKPNLSSMRILTLSTLAWWQ